MSNIISQTIKASIELNTSKKVASKEEFIARGGRAYYNKNLKKALRAGMFTLRNRKWLKK